MIYRGLSIEIVEEASSDAVPFRTISSSSNVRDVPEGVRIWLKAICAVTPSGYRDGMSVVTPDGVYVIRDEDGHGQPRLLVAAALLAAEREGLKAIAFNLSSFLDITGGLTYDHIPRIESMAKGVEDFALSVPRDRPRSIARVEVVVEEGEVLVEKIVKSTLK